LCAPPKPEPNQFSWLNLEKVFLGRPGEYLLQKKPLPQPLRYTSSQPTMRRHVLIFGVVGGLLIAALQ
jgi:hypothetical protein